MSYVGSKLHFNCGDHPDEAFWTKSGHLWPSEDLFRGQKARYRTYCGLRRALFACIMALWGPLHRLQRSENGSVMPALLTWASGTIMWWNQIWWNQIWCHTRLPEGQKVPYRGQADPLDPPRPPKTPPNPLKTPPNLPKTNY